ncbi:MAG: bifunctional folylpolyglutamate synthase/dihydrofolate synthase, partial [Dinghuibacter sp.]|nr:bifunctional folylpolyglutamate synthase/dihydrofolate synthase [Dinghuibacter sp.]
RVDVSVIETGLGGRLDSTNIISPRLSIITNIGMDHMNMLGNTLTAIAGEKAGIIKPGTPVVIGEALPETRPVFNAVAQTNNSPVVYAEEEFQITQGPPAKGVLSVSVQHKNTEAQYESDLTGAYQVKNIRTVLCSVAQLQQAGFIILPEHIAEGLRHAASLTGLQGRWEQLHTQPDIILDVAHNEDGIKQLAHVWENSAYPNIHIVTGMVKDKDVAAVLRLLPKNAQYYFTQAQIPRALDKEELRNMAAGMGLVGQTHENVNLAIQAALQQAQKNDLILVMGSVFLAGEVKRPISV